ncbi:MAG TPA: hypothetical protein VIK57_09390 [Streptosporangiaceae bacterium]
MNRPALLASVVLAATMTLAAGCGTAASSQQQAAPASPVAPPSLATSLATATGTWAVAVMGGSAASHNNFWQLFVRPAGTSRWRLTTPPGVASNGGLVLTGLASGSVLAGFRPSQRLGYSPLAITKDNGKAWSPGLFDAGLADIPGALAADPASGRLLALLTDGTTEISSPGGTRWMRLVTRRVLATSPAGTRCQLDSVTAAAFSPSGHPLLGAGCSRPGTAGIFSQNGRTWQLSGPALPAAYAHQAITVLRLTTSGKTTTALLAAGTGPTARLLAGWSADGGAHWTLSPPLPLNGVTLTSASPGPGSSLAITLTHRRAAVITSAAGPWRLLPVLPPGTATLAPGPSGGWNALAVHGTKLTIWQAAPGAQSWASAQVIKVPIPFGSSG